MSQRTHVSVLIEYPDGRVEYKNWTGPTIRAIHRAACKHYAGAEVSFGTGFYEWWWGAH